MLSIVIPVFNSADTLAETLQSLAQSGVASQEIVLVDDGSTDRSWEIISSYRSEHDNVVALRHDRNRGGGAARNTGIAAAQHPIIYIIDSDDLLIPDALARALAHFDDPSIDGVASGKAIRFKTHPDSPHEVSSYKSGIAGFRDLVTPQGSPFWVNYLYRKSAYLKAGGFPEHHGLDTHGYAFRLLGNNLRVHVTDEPLFYQRLPQKPSYYIRELKSGNVGRGWYYVFSEYLYKFRPDIRERILTFPYADPALLAKGQTLYAVLAALSDQEDIFDANGLALDDASAAAQYGSSSDPTLQAWCAIHHLKRHDLGSFMDRLRHIEDKPYARRLIYPLLATWSRDGLKEVELSEFRYFFARDKGRSWWMRTMLQKVRNRLERLISRT